MKPKSPTHHSFLHWPHNPEFKHLTICNILCVRLCERVQVTSAIHKYLLLCSLCYRTCISLEWPLDRILTNDMGREGQGRMLFPKSKRSGFKSKPLCPIRFTQPPSCCMEHGLMLDSVATIHIGVMREQKHAQRCM